MDSHERMGIIASARNLDGQDFDLAVADLGGPGRYEGVHDKELALAIDTIYGHGCHDDQVGGIVQVGSALLEEDDRGFRTLATFDTYEIACDVLASIAENAEELEEDA